jgi:hypothetical protein
MSTKAIEKALYILHAHGEFDGSESAKATAADARAELEAIRKAAKEVVDQRALETWQSSMPTTLADAIRTIQSIAKEGP